MFDAYSTASFRVRNDYTDNLKSGKHLDPLLRFLVDVLGHALARALDLDKEGFTAEHIRSYSIDLADSEPAERDMNWLLIHLFYLILKYIPGLFKMWYLDCPSKQTKNTIQSWMQRFFSPLIISDALDEVVEWAAHQETGDPDTQEIVVKVSKPMHEIMAGYPVDDDAATISLHVPKSYPLDPVDVVSVKRVAVKEDKWQAWLKATKAVIMFGVSLSLFYSPSPLTSPDLILTVPCLSELQPGRRSDRLPPQHLVGHEGPGGVRHLLLHHCAGQDAAGQEVRNMQPLLPPCLPVQVVPEQREKHVSAVSERY